MVVRYLGEGAEDFGIKGAITAEHLTFTVLSGEAVDDFADEGLRWEFRSEELRGVVIYLDTYGGYAMAADDQGEDDATLVEYAASVADLPEPD